MDLSLEVELDSDKEGRVLLIAVLVDGALENLACGRGERGRSVRPQILAPPRLHTPQQLT
jgi:hypothetical protein